MPNSMIHTCKICGYTNKNFTPWGANGMHPMFEICPCCGIESGYEDISLESIEHHRKKWMESSKYKSNIKYRYQLERYLEQAVK